MFWPENIDGLAYFILFLAHQHPPLPPHPTEGTQAKPGSISRKSELRCVLAKQPGPWLLHSTAKNTRNLAAECPALGAAMASSRAPSWSNPPRLAVPGIVNTQPRAPVSSVEQNQHLPPWWCSCTASTRGLSPVPLPLRLTARNEPRRALQHSQRMS